MQRHTGGRPTGCCLTGSRPTLLAKRRAWRYSARAGPGPAAGVTRKKHRLRCRGRPRHRPAALQQATWLPAAGGGRPVDLSAGMFRSLDVSNGADGVLRGPSSPPSRAYAQGAGPLTPSRHYHMPIVSMPLSARQDARLRGGAILFRLPLRFVSLFASTSLPPRLGCTHAAACREPGCVVCSRLCPYFPSFAMNA